MRNHAARRVVSANSQRAQICKEIAQNCRCPSLRTERCLRRKCIYVTLQLDCARIQRSPTDMPLHPNLQAPQLLALVSTLRAIKAVPRSHHIDESFDQIIAELRIRAATIQGLQGRVADADQIGRASCRERVEITVVAVAVKKKR